MKINMIECQPIKPPMNFGSAKKYAENAQNAQPSVKNEKNQIIQELTNKQSLKFGLTASGIVIGLVLLISYLYPKSGGSVNTIKKRAAAIVKKPLLMLENKKVSLIPQKAVLMLENLLEKRKYMNTDLLDLYKIRQKSL